MSPVRESPILFTSLAAVAGGRLWAAPCDSVTAALEALRFHRAACLTGAYGGILVYRDDNLCYRCLFHDAGDSLPRAAEIFALKEVQVGAWLRRWLPNLHTAPRRRAHRSCSEGGRAA